MVSVGRPAQEATVHGCTNVKDKQVEWKLLDVVASHL